MGQDRKSEAIFKAGMQNKITSSIDHLAEHLSESRAHLTLSWSAGERWIMVIKPWVAITDGSGIT